MSSPNFQEGRIHKQAFIISGPQIAWADPLLTCADVNRCSPCPLLIECGLTFLCSSTRPQTTLYRRCLLRCRSLLHDMRNSYNLLRYRREDVSSASLFHQPSRRRNTSRLTSAVIRLSQVDHRLPHACLVCHYGRQIQLSISFQEVDRSCSALGHLLVGRYCF